MKVLYAFILVLLVQCYSADAMRVQNKKSMPLNVDVVTKMALSSVIFSAMYALADLSSGNCSKTTLLHAIKDGFITGGIVGCSLMACDDLPTTVPGIIWVAAVGIAPAVLVINNFLLKRAIGLSNS